MPSGGAAAIALATSGKAPRRPVAAAAPRTVCAALGVRLWSEANGAPPFGAEGTDVTLDVGVVYQLFVTLSKAVCGPDTITIGDSPSLAVEWRGDPKVTLSADPYQMSADDFAGESSFKLEFTLDVPSGAAISTGEISLHYNEGSMSRLRPLLRVGIHGAHHAPPLRFEESVKVRLQDTPDPAVAFIHVVAVDKGLQVTGYHSTAGTLSTIIPQPAMSLADAADEKPSVKVRNVVLEYSRESVPLLLAWLDKVLTLLNDKVSFVIAEHADSRVPWEMLVIKADDAPLGARAVVTRWTSVQRYKDAVWLNLQAEKVASGRVLNFVDPSGLKHGDAEKDELGRCAQTPCDSVEGLFNALQTLPSDVALVFLACHGVLAKDEQHRVELQDVKNPSGTVTTLKLEGLASPKHQPALVVNACHSARLVRTQTGISGLPAFFLASFARSFVGTLGAVDDEVAAAVGAQLLKEARSPDGVCISDFLLRMRKSAARDFKNGTITARKLVSCFMYVFYGSPADRLQLDAKAKVGDG